MIRVMLFDRYDQPIGELSEHEVFALDRVEQVNGEHSLTITTTRVLEQGWRVLTQDARGKWREHVVYGTDAAHATGEQPFGDYYCVWSLQHDLMGTRISRMPGVQTPVAASLALGYAIEGTARWQVGTVTNTATGGASMYDTNGWDAISILVKNWGGEVDATIEVGTGGITARKVDLYAQQGDQTAKRRFDFGADLKSVRRKIADGPLYCRITPRGMGEETDSGGYGRKVTIESVNDGKDYLENAAMKDLAKLPDGNGGWEYPTLEVENADCDTPAKLLAWAQTVVEDYTTPKITYGIDVLQLAKEGVDMHGVSLGDAIHVVDRKFGGLRVSGRVMAMRVNMLDEADAELTVGDITNGFIDILGGFDSRINAVTSTVQAINGGTMSTANYLSRLIDRINAEVNGSGGYTYITEGQGIRCYNKAVADPLDGTDADSVVEIKGGTIRIANSKTAQGQWDWKSLFQSGRIATDIVVGARLISGSIGNANGDNYWDLDNNLIKLGPTVLLDDTSIEDALAAIDAAITETDVQYRYSDSATELTGDYTWQTSSLPWVNGRYIWTRTKTVKTTGTSYSAPVCLTGAKGESVTVSSIQYGTSASASTEPSSWSTTAPTVTKGQWLWVKTTYSDGSTTTAKSYAGTDGQDGASVYVQSSTKTGGTTTLVLTDGTTSTTITIDDGEDGSNGTPGANGYVHIAWATSADGSQGFSTSDSANKTYIGVYTDNTSADSQTYSDYSWSLIKGADGANGYNTASVLLYQRAASSPSKPSSSLTYTFSTHALSGTLGNWSTGVPSGTDPCWVIAATATSTGATDTIASSEWTSPVKLVENGANGTNGTNGTNGADGLNQATVFLYQRAASQPSKPSSSVTYTFATGALSSTPSGWSRSVPASNGNPCWVTTAVAISTGATDSIASTDWATPTKMVEDGADGADGADGSDGVGIASIVEQYYLSSSNTTQVDGSWSNTQPAWSPNHYIWTRSYITWEDNTTDTTTPVLAGGLNSANEEAAKANAVVRTYNSGVLLCRQGNTVGALVNASGSFDIVSVSWVGNVPTAGASLATFGTTTYIGNGTHGIEITDQLIALELESERAFEVGYTPASGGSAYNWYMLMDFMTGMFRCKTSGYNQPRQLSTEGYPLVFLDGSTPKYWNGTAYAAQTVNKMTIGSRASGTEANYSFSFGQSNVVSGNDSAAFGKGLIAQDTVQTVLGIANVAKNGPLLIIGNGMTEGPYRSNVFEVNYDGGAWLSGTLTQTSDKRLKKHIAYLGEDAVRFIRKLKPVLFSRKKVKQLGFYAQDVQDADEWGSSLVTSTESDDRLGFETLCLEYTSIIAPLVAYAQSLEQRIEQLEARVAALEGSDE